MKVRTYEEMFLDVKENGQFIPGVKPPGKDSKTFRQVFEREIDKKLNELTKVKFGPSVQPKTLAGDILETGFDIFTGRDSVMERAIFAELCGMICSFLGVAQFYLDYSRQNGCKKIYVGEFPLSYYENEDHVKVDKAGRKYSTAMDIFYLMSAELEQRNLWYIHIYDIIQRNIDEIQDYLKEIKPGFLAGKKKKEDYERQKASKEKEILKLKYEYISQGNDVDNYLIEIRLMRLWVLNAGETDKKEDRKIRKNLMERLDSCEKYVLRKAESITAMERELGIENNTFEAYKPKK